MGRPCPPAYRGLLGPIFTVCSRALWLVDRWLLEPVLIRPVDWMMNGLTWLYSWILTFAVRLPWFFISAGALLAATALVFVSGANVPTPWGSLVIKPIGRELVPSEDQSRLLVNVICPVGSSIDYVDDMLLKGEKILAGLERSRDEGRCDRDLFLRSFDSPWFAGQRRDRLRAASPHG